MGALTEEGLAGSGGRLRARSTVWSRRPVARGYGEGTGAAPLEAAAATAASKALTSATASPRADAEVDRVHDALTSGMVFGRSRARWIGIPVIARICRRYLKEGRRTSFSQQLTVECGVLGFRSSPKLPWLRPRARRQRRNSSPKVAGGEKVSNVMPGTLCRYDLGVKR